MPTTNLYPQSTATGRPFTHTSARIGIPSTVPCRITDIEQQILHDERALQEADNQRLAEAESTRQEQLRREAEQRQAAAEILLGHLLLTEIMMASIVDNYVYKVCATLTERGLMRHNVKRLANQLRTVSTDLMSRCRAHDLAYVAQYTRHIYPSLVQPYIDGGGTLTIKLQAEFYKANNQRINLIYFSTKNAHDKIRVPHSDLMTDLSMITMLTYTGIEFYEIICQKTDHLMQGFGRIHRVKSNHNEKMLCAAKELMRFFGGQCNMPEEVAKHPRTLTAQFQQELTSVELLNNIEHSIVSLKMDFIEFVIATLRIKLSGGRLPVTDVRTLVARVGSIKNVRLLLSEISAIPLPEGDDWDVIDLAQSLPPSAPESALSTFRRLCLEDHVLLPEPEDVTILLLRELRQESRSNGGILPLGTIKHLFSEMKTKKAVIELLERGGEELRRSAKRVKEFKVGELRAGKESELS